MAGTELAIAITGAGGAGVISVGELLLQAWAKEVRGGESAALLKLTETERYTAASQYDVLLAFDWNNFTRFGDEIRIARNTPADCS